MGFFSWKTADTNKSISNVYSNRDTFTVYVLQPNGLPPLKEDSYQGYGEFAGRDIYALVAQWNFPDMCKDAKSNWLPDEEIRNFGIDIACYDKDNAALEFPIKIVENPNLRYEDVPPSIGCPDQGYFYEDELEDDIVDEIEEDEADDFNLFDILEL